MTPTEIHRDAVQYLAAVRRMQARLQARLREPLDGGERRLTTQALEALETRHDEALVALHAAADALVAAQPACCQGTPVPHRCGKPEHRNHCTAETCW